MLSGLELCRNNSYGKRGANCCRAGAVAPLPTEQSAKQPGFGTKKVTFEVDGIKVAALPSPAAAVTQPCLPGGTKPPQKLRAGASHQPSRAQVATDSPEDITQV